MNSSYLTSYEVIDGYAIQGVYDQLSITYLFETLFLHAFGYMILPILNPNYSLDGYAIGE